MSDPIPAAAAAAAAAFADGEAKRKEESQEGEESASDSDAEEAEGEGENGSDEDGDKEKGDAKSKNVKNSSGASPAAADLPGAHDARLARLGSLAAVVVDPASEGDEAALLSAVTDLRKLVSVQVDPPFRALLDQPGLVKRLIELLGQQYPPRLIFESAWTLTNLASGPTSQVRYLVAAGAVAAFVELLIIDLSREVTEQALWALGNIASDEADIRNAVHKAGTLHTVLALLSDESPVGLRRHGSWLIRAMCRGKPLVGWGQVADAFDLLARWFLAEDQDVEVLENVSVAMSHMSECEDLKAAQAVLDHGLLPRAKGLLEHHRSVEVRMASLRIFGNLAQGSDEQTQAVVDCGVLPTFVTLLSSPRRDPRKEAAHILSNICAGSVRQVQAVLDAQALPDLMRLVADRMFWDISNEALWAIANAASGGGREQWRFLVDHGAHRCLYDQLSNLDRGYLGRELMRGLSNLVDILYESDAQSWRNELRDLGVKDHLRRLVDAHNAEIAQAAQYILEKFDEEEEEEEAEEEEQQGEQQQQQQQHQQQQQQQQQPEQPQEQEAPAVRELEGQMRVARIDEQPGADAGAVQGESENA